MNPPAPGERAPASVDQLNSADAGERAAACRALVNEPNAVFWLDALGEALGDSERRVRRAAADALVALARQHPDALAVLRSALRGTRRAARFPAAYALARLETPGPALLPALAEALASPDGDERWAAARTLVDLGRLHDEVARAVHGLALGADDARTRRMAVFCLRELAPSEPATASALAACSRDPDLELRRASLTAMAGLIGPPPEVFERLVEVLGDPRDAPSQRLAALALGELAVTAGAPLPQRAALALNEAARQADDPDLQHSAARSLARVGSDPAPPR